VKIAATENESRASLEGFSEGGISILFLQLKGGSGTAGIGQIRTKSGWRAFPSVDEWLTNSLRFSVFPCASLRIRIFTKLIESSLVKKHFRGLAGGGARTHTILRSLDFESSASANSATPAVPPSQAI
jgi:hypothetical protein